MTVPLSPSGDLFRAAHSERASGNIQDLERLASALKTLRDASIITPTEARTILKRFGWVEGSEDKPGS